MKKMLLKTSFQTPPTTTPTQSHPSRRYVPQELPDLDIENRNKKYCTRSTAAQYHTVIASSSPSRVHIAYSPDQDLALCSEAQRTSSSSSLSPAPSYWCRRCSSRNLAAMHGGSFNSASSSRLDDDYVGALVEEDR